MATCGKHRGVVTSNVDPQRLGRLQVQVPSVLGEVSVFALPCVPYAGNGVGMLFLPPVGADVWVEFEAGDINAPIWSGGFWSSGAPAAAAGPDKFIETDGVKLTFDGATGGFRLEFGAMRLVLDATGIHVTNAIANLDLVGPTVSINSGAVVVT